MTDQGGVDHSEVDHSEVDHSSVYDGLTGGDDSQWAFGTDFEDPLAGVDTTIPDGVDAATLAQYCLMLGDVRWSTPTGSRGGRATRPTWRRTSRWPTSRWTCSGRPGCSWPGRRRPTPRPQATPWRRSP